MPANGSGTRTQSDVTVTGGNNTTTVTVNQDAAVTAVDAVDAVAGANETATVVFSALTIGQTVILDGLTFTASAAMTATEAATIFENLAAGATHGAATKGVYTGALSSDYTTGAVSGTSSNTVVFTSVVKANDGTNIANTGTGTAAVTVVNGSSATTAVTGVAGIVGGAVVIADGATTTDTIATVTLDGYGASSTITSDALTTLSIANSAQDLTITNATATTLALTVDNVTAGSVVDDNSGTYTTINITTANADSDIDLDAAAATTLTVAGTNALDLTGATLTALTTLTVSGSASLTMDGDEADTLTSVNTSATTGTTTITIGGDTATYTGGAGVDNVTLDSTTVNKAINLGAGNNSLTLATGTTSLTTEMIAGSGTDTLVMASADAITASSTTVFETKITGFEKLSLGANTTTGTVDLANMDDMSYVVSANSAAGAEIQTFTITHGTDAEVAEVQTFTTTGSTGAGTAVVAGVNVAIGGALTADQVGALIAAEDYSGNANISSVTYLGGIVRITYTTAAGDQAAAVINDDNGNTGIVFGAVLDNAVAYDSNTGNIAIEGVNVAVAADLTADQVGALITAADYSSTTIASVAYNSTTDTVTVTYDAGVNEAATTAVDTDTTGVAFGSITTTVDGSATTALTLDNMANNGTLELTAAGSGVVVTMDDATSTTADIFNILLSTNTNGTVAMGTVSVAGVETIHITTADTNTASTDSNVPAYTMTLSDAAVKTMTISGNAALTLTNTDNVALTSLNASSMTAALTATTNGTVAETITGGSGNDVLTTSKSGDVLIGGEGNDTLTGTELVTLTGGAGNDIFVADTVSSNVNSYMTITDATAGDYIKFTGADSFASSAVELGSTAVFQDYANEAINLIGANDIAWFQFDGNTYLVMDKTDTTVFTENQDVIVKLTGLIDLSTATFNDTADTIQLF
ncbi:Hemolysin-type calcium-binding region [Sulfurimonas denitrificans DSM 1251]|uniref:Hemolysin-type calcium-binding region n=1 Tax=Sulfurimonas denitrificans (strain ATCC 33889 / DSM 1251) TaxID=326298 RepID=Q30PU0_SULDN|nr:hypothetical protein [Sulfurimonas denitrificans]ABB44991.1 Hemolysin-type calcium-binding region [Sulfurimonas denitrificans DSM 1251]